MKKFIKLTLIISIIVMIMTGSTFAVSGNLSIKTKESNVEKGKEFTVEVSLNNMKSEGVIGFGGILEYDKAKLELVKIEGQNGWETPVEGASYNSQTGDIAINRNSLGKNDETILKITFKAKENAKTNSIMLKDVMVSDGKTSPLSIATVATTVTQSQVSDLPVVNTNTEGNNTNNNQSGSQSTSQNNNQNSSNNNNNNSNNSNTNNNNNNNSNSNNNHNNNNSSTNNSLNNNQSNSTSSEQSTNKTNKVKDNTVVQSQNLPQTGTDNTVLILSIGSLSIIAIRLFIKMRNNN